jgi:hypothetical protein
VLLTRFASRPLETNFTAYTVHPTPCQTVCRLFISVPGERARDGKAAANAGLVVFHVCIAESTSEHTEDLHLDVQHPHLKTKLHRVHTTARPIVVPVCCIVSVHYSYTIQIVEGPRASVCSRSLVRAFAPEGASGESVPNVVFLYSIIVVMHHSCR